MRTVLVLLSLIWAGHVMAQFNRPSIGPGSLVPIGPSSSATGSSGGGGGGGCSNALDFSQACNSQYFVLLLW